MFWFKKDEAKTVVADATAPVISAEEVAKLHEFGVEMNASDEVKACLEKNMTYVQAVETLLTCAKEEFKVLKTANPTLFNKGQGASSNDDNISQPKTTSEALKFVQIKEPALSASAAYLKAQDLFPAVFANPYLKGTK